MTKKSDEHEWFHLHTKKFTRAIAILQNIIARCPLWIRFNWNTYFWRNVYTYSNINHQARKKCNQFWIRVDLKTIFRLLKIASESRCATVIMLAHDDRTLIRKRHNKPAINLIAVQIAHMHECVCVSVVHAGEKDDIRLYTCRKSYAGIIILFECHIQY